MPKYRPFYRWRLPIILTVRENILPTYSFWFGGWLICLCSLLGKGISFHQHVDVTTSNSRLLSQNFTFRFHLKERRFLTAKAGTLRDSKNLESYEKLTFLSHRDLIKTLIYQIFEIDGIRYISLSTCTKVYLSTISCSQQDDGTRPFHRFKNSRNFNQPVDTFNTAKVTTMESMFENAEAFNQCISTWADETPSDVITTNMFVISNSAYSDRDGCPIQTDPNPSVGPWCQPPDSESSTTCKEYTPIPTQSPTPFSPPRRTIPPTAQGPECNDQLKSETRFQFRKNKRYNCEKLEEFFEGKSDTLKKRTCKKTTTTAKGEEATISTFCPRTCGICPDQCKDSRKKFLVTERKMTKERNCKFYYRTVFGQKKACRANVELLNGKKRKMFILCPKFCAGFGLGVCAPAANPEPPYVSNSF